MVLEILWSIIRIIIEIILIAGIIWLILPYIFHWIVSPNFNGAYKYKKEDFEADGVTPKNLNLSQQQNEFKFEIDKILGSYKINFGENRDLLDGKIRIHYNNKWFSNNPDSNELQLNLISLNEPSENINPTSFKSTNGSCKIFDIQWNLEGTNKKIETKFEIYKNYSIQIEEPDRKINVEKIENLNFIVFSLYFFDELENTMINDFSKPIFEFPNLQNASPNNRYFTYKNSIFSPPTNNIDYTNAPRIFFDNNLNSFIISALDEFMININRVDDNNRIKCGLEGEIEKIESGYKSSYILLFGKGISNTFENLGDLLRIYHNQKRKSMYMDIIDSYIGYWTDNGAYYYYNPIKGMKDSETLIEVNKHIEKIGIPFKYFDLDSWWYEKDVEQWKRKLLGNIGRILGGGLYGGTIEWKPDPNTMHVNVGKLSELLDKPFIAHNRWYSAKTKHLNDYNFYVEGDKSICIDYDFWDMIMSNCEKWNIVCYEQDWMNNQIKAFKILRDQTRNADKWLMSMGDAANKHNRTIQYCMANPGMFLTSVKIPAVSHARSSGDYHPRWPRSYDYRFLTQTGILSYALRIWPYKDVYRSTCEGPINGEKMPEFMTIISTLSCGPVGPGDAIGSFGKDTIMRACRKDGLILKPDKSLRAVDSIFIPNCKYYIASTYSEHGKYRWEYLLINKLTITQPKNKEIALNDLGIKDKRILAYDYNDQIVTLFDIKNPLKQRLKGQDYKYWILSPFISENLAIIGDISKYTTMSFKEFIDLNVKEHEIEIKIDNIKGEFVKLLIYDDSAIKSILLNDVKIKKQTSKKKPKQIQENNVWIYNDKMKLSLITISFNKDSIQKIQIHY